MTAPTPRQFDLAVAQAMAHIRERMQGLPELYARAYFASHERVVRDTVGKISRGSVSDPTAEIVGDPRDPRRPGAQRAIRVALERAEGHMADAENAIGAASQEISKAMDRLDPRESFEPTRYPITVTNAELDESYAAQVRRRTSGEGVG